MTAGHGTKRHDAKSQTYNGNAEAEAEAKAEKSKGIVKREARWLHGVAWRGVPKAGAWSGWTGAALFCSVLYCCTVQYCSLLVSIFSNTVEQQHAVAVDLDWIMEHTTRHEKTRQDNGNTSLHFTSIQFTSQLPECTRVYNILYIQHKVQYTVGARARTHYNTVLISHSHFAIVREAAVKLRAVHSCTNASIARTEATIASSV